MEEIQDEVMYMMSQGFSQREASVLSNMDESTIDAVLDSMYDDSLQGYSYVW